MSRALDTRKRLVQIYLERARRQNVSTTLRELVHPLRTLRHIRRIALADTQDIPNEYPDTNRDEDIQFCAEVLQLPTATIDAAFVELEEDERFIGQLTAAYSRYRKRKLHLGRFRCWWAIVRLTRPSTIVETGVHDGLSTAVTLNALHKNGAGRLFSIDLPSVDLPIGGEGPGWLVPEELKDRWKLYIGDARRLLPRLVRQIGSVDLFIHDSNHTAKHQEFEYRTVRPYLSKHGLLAGDDPIDDLMARLGQEWSATSVILHRRLSNGRLFSSLGAIRFESAAAETRVPAYQAQGS